MVAHTYEKHHHDMTGLPQSCRRYGWIGGNYYYVWELRRKFSVMSLHKPVVSVMHGKQSQAATNGKSEGKG